MTAQLPLPGSVDPLGQPVEQGPEPLGHLVVVDPLESVRGDRGDRRVDAPHQVGAPGRGVLVGGLEQGLDGEVDGGLTGHGVAPADLDHGAGVEAARAGAGLEALLVPAAGDVVLEQPPLSPPQVVPGEERHHGQTLHGGGQVVAHHLGELVGLALERDRRALDLLVVLELQLEQPHHLDRRSGGTGDGHAGVTVGGEDLLDPAMADQVARGRPAVTGHHHTVVVAHGDHRGAVGDLQGIGRRAGQGGRLEARSAHEGGEVGPGIVVRGEHRHRHDGRGYWPTAPLPFGLDT